MNKQSKTIFIVLAVAIETVFIANTVLSISVEASKLVKEKLRGKVRNELPGVRRHL